MPIFSAILSFFILGRRISSGMFFGLVIGIIGVATIVGLGPINLDGSIILASLASLAAAFCYALSAVLTVFFFSKSSNIKISFLSLTSASVILLPFSLANVSTNVKLDLEAVWAIFFLGFFCTGLAYIIYFRLLTSVGPTVSSCVTFCVPIFGILWGTIFLEEIFTLSMALGCFFILIAGILVFLNRDIK